MNIIVTGGAGFIGSNFVFHMLKKYPDYRIICLDKLTYAGNLSTLAPVMDNPNFRFVKADICDREAVDKLFKEEHPDIVVNFAAESHVDRSIENPEVFLNTNILIIRFLPMKFTVTCRWIVLICSSPRKLRSTPALRTVAPRLPLTCWFWLTTVPTVCL